MNIAETECKVSIKFIDMSGKERTCIVNHNGEDDCWDAVTIIEDDTEVAFDFNTFDGIVYGDKEGLLVNAYQCTIKRDGCWTMDDAKELKVISFEVIDEEETKYSKEQFEGFTHRFIVKFKVNEDWRNDTNITLYSNSDSYQKLEDFINAKKSDKILSFKIEHRASKEQDEMSSKFIDEMLADGGF